MIKFVFVVCRQELRDCSDSTPFISESAYYRNTPQRRRAAEDRAANCSIRADAQRLHRSKMYAPRGAIIRRARKSARHSGAVAAACA
jgi:hypothetical protein